MKGKIEEAFDYLYAEVIIHYADIPKRLLDTDSDGNVIVDLDVFTDRIDGRERREPKLVGLSTRIKEVDLMVGVLGN
ncbi:hypothetical protein [Brevibacillus laterosporus]|uniref:hypothetical protein n=1 Tax=Brevibacillus laterosporus TaxID=1465 RepID=UPI001F3618DE|nr:hypothetical protein [Brevibacillus laterosporus]